MSTGLSRRRWLSLLAAAATWPTAARSQSFDGRPIRIVVPYPPGGPTDALARLVARHLHGTQAGPNGAPGALAGALASPSAPAVIVENKAGASGAVGTRDVARSTPDGHTLVLGTNQTHVTNAWLVKEPGYDPQRDFVPIAGLADLQHVLVVRRDLGVASVGELIARARAAPSDLLYGSTGPGSASHLTMELFQSRAGIKLTHVPFRGAAPMALEIVAGRIACAFATLPSVLGQIEGGEMRALALASDRRAPQLPGLELLKDVGVTGSEGDAWLALFAPSGTPPPLVARIEAAVLQVMSQGDVTSAATTLGMVVNPRGSEVFRRYLAEETARWADVIRIAGLRPE